MGFFDLFSRKNKDAIMFCKVLSKMNKLMNEFNSGYFANGRIDKYLHKQIKFHFEDLNQSILAAQIEYVEKLMETPITRYSDGEVQIALLSKSNYTLGSTWFRSRMDFERIDRIVDPESYKLIR
jgi:hypothetical protein